MSAEESGEVKRIRESDPFGNFLNLQIVAEEQMAGVGESQAGQESIGSFWSKSPEETGEISAVEMEGLREVCDRA